MVADFDDSMLDCLHSVFTSKMRVHLKVHQLQVVNTSSVLRELENTQHQHVIDT